MSSPAEKIHTDELAATDLDKPASVTAGTNWRPVWFTNDMLQAAWGRDNNSGASGAYCPPAGGDENSSITHVEFGSQKTAVVAFHSLEPTSWQTFLWTPRLQQKSFQAP